MILGLNVRPFYLTGAFTDSVEGLDLETTRPPLPNLSRDLSFPVVYSHYLAANIHRLRYDLGPQ